MHFHYNAATWDWEITHRKGQIEANDFLLHLKVNISQTIEGMHILQAWYLGHSYEMLRRNSRTFWGMCLFALLLKVR